MFKLNHPDPTAQMIIRGIPNAGQPTLEAVVQTTGFPGVEEGTFNEKPAVKLTFTANGEAESGLPWSFFEQAWQQSVMPSDIDQTIVAWEAIVDQYITGRRGAIERNPHWPLEDIRIGIYGLPANVLVTGLLNTKMVKSCLLNKIWWNQNVQENREIEKRQHQTDQYVLHSKVMVYTQFISMLESVLRRILRVLKPGACDNAHAAFATVYKCLLVHLGLDRHLSFLDFARTLRNLIHNNGIYINKGNTNEVLSFAGRTYTFEYGKAVQFAYPELLFGIYQQSLVLIDDLVDCDKVKAMSVAIID